MLTLEVITPKQIMLTTEVEQVTLPGELGELGILPGHIPLLTSLKTGVLQYGNGKETQVLAIHFGFAEVNKNTVTVLANSAESLEEIDVSQTEAQIEELKGQLKEAAASSSEAAQLTKQLAQAETRLAAVQAAKG